VYSKAIGADELNTSKMISSEMLQHLKNNKDQYVSKFVKRSCSSLDELAVYLDMCPEDQTVRELRRRIDRKQQEPFNGASREKIKILKLMGATNQLKKLLEREINLARKHF
jgi:hypothetical protein